MEVASKLKVIVRWEVAASLEEKSTPLLCGCFKPSINIEGKPSQWTLFSETV